MLSIKDRLWSSGLRGRGSLGGEGDWRAHAPTVEAIQMMTRQEE